jgi:hypothetical protein
VLGVAAAAGLWALGCSVSAPSENPTTPGPTARAMDAGAADTGAVASGDAAGVDAPQAATTVGYALCADSTGCDPDVATTSQACGLAPDGGPFDPTAGYGPATLACRVQPATSISANGMGLAPVCSVAGTGGDGDACKASTDCAARFDCVGNGECRHYCCGGNAQCGSDQFCDVQPLAVATTTKVPVCMPITPSGGCALLEKTPCPGGETCAIVRDDGTTGCVESGPQGVGQSCETDHCKAGLVCLGAPNARQCYGLCSTKSSACTAPETCQGGLPLFQDPSVGICR